VDHGVVRKDSFHFQSALFMGFDTVLMKKARPSDQARPSDRAARSSFVPWNLKSPFSSE